jgi:hypothetical protein
MGEDEGLHDIGHVVSDAVHTLKERGLPEPKLLDRSAIKAEIGAFACLRKYLRNGPNALRQQNTEDQRGVCGSIYDSLIGDSTHRLSSLEKMLGHGMTISSRLGPPAARQGAIRAGRKVDGVTTQLSPARRPRPDVLSLAYQHGHPHLLDLDPLRRAQTRRLS